MGIEALTQRDDGAAVAVPESRDDWRLWVSAGRTRNWMLNDPLIDWLQLYGESRGYRPEREVGSYAANLDFLAFIFEQGQRFEDGILRLLRERYEVVTVAEDYREISRLDKAEATFDAMRRGIPVIYQGVLWDAENLNYGSPDFLVRSDVLRELFPGDVSASEAAASAPDLGADGWHYRVVDTKFTTLHLNAAGTELGNWGSARAYKAQLFIYNRMLGRLQGYLPSESYVLGRGWEREQSRVKYRGNSALERLGRVPQNSSFDRGKTSLESAVEDALGWVRRVRSEGADWQLHPEPSVPELYPNMSSSDDGSMMREVDLAEPEPGFDESDSKADWEPVKKWLASELKELTLLWRVGVGGRNQAHESGIYRWDDPQVTPGAVGVGGSTTGPTLAQMLAVNADGGPLILPERIEETRDEWHDGAGLEFYVDFEFCSDLNDDFANLPEKGGQPLIFMIGCGHLEDGEWSFEQFTTGSLTEDEEIRIIREWFAHMADVGERLAHGSESPRIFHWSPAEVSALESAYNSARARHGARGDWPELNWYDFLNRVMREEPVTVQGALGFGLKAVATAMRRHGWIETDWADSPVDGLGAMVGAWRCDEEARQRGVSMASLRLMGEIAGYNEVDCRAMMEIVRYLRGHH